MINVPEYVWQGAVKMLNKTIKVSFAIVGTLTGYTLIRVILPPEFYNNSPVFGISIYITAAFVSAAVFYLTGSKIIEVTISAIEKFEVVIQRLTLYEMVVGAGGLIIGLVIANLVTLPIGRVNFIGLPVSIAANIFFGYVGLFVVSRKCGENIIKSFRSRMNTSVKPDKSECLPKILDTSAIIDGRIAEICRSGFMNGELILPQFILDELRHIADSPDALKRSRGRRGLDVIAILQNELKYPVRIDNTISVVSQEVDIEILNLAKKLNAQVITTDYNLGKVASVQGVQVLNINELANSVKPIAIPGEEMIVQVIKDGKENGQGIGYLGDGTMIVVDGGRKFIGENVSVLVTSVLQTSAGRMIFAKPKFSIERVI